VTRGEQDPFDPDPPERPEPSSRVLLAWSGLAAGSLLFAMVAVTYGLPESARLEAAVDTMPTGSVPGSGIAEGRNAIAVIGRGDFALRAAENSAELAPMEVENAALRQADALLRTRVEELTDRVAALELRLGTRVGGVDGADLASPSLFAIELGTFADLASARDEWERLVTDQPQLFSDLRPVVNLRDRDSGPELVLVAGPFDEAAAAAARCAAAGEENVACLPGYFVGQPLPLR
jgi:hypothetical protein